MTSPLAAHESGGDSPAGAVLGAMIVAGGKVTKDFEHPFPHL